jgi:L-ribulose-5-phosphate 3-epimerase
MKNESEGGHLSRRAFVGAISSAAVSPLLAQRVPGLKIGTMDGVLNLSGKPDAVRLAEGLNLAAVQVTLGHATHEGKLPLEDAGLQGAFRAASDKYGIPIDSTYLDMLHVNCLKNDRLASKWVEKGIGITKNLNASILMTVFFGKCQVLQRRELDYVVDRFRELVPHAERAGVILGFENTSSGEDNRYAVDKVASKAFKVWYDVGNSTYNGYDVPREIRMLGRDRICQFHFKDHGYLGEGKVDYPPILRAIADIQFRGYANLETTSPSGSVVADTRRNLAYLKKLMA